MGTQIYLGILDLPPITGGGPPCPAKQCTVGDVNVKFFTVKRSNMFIDIFERVERPFFPNAAGLPEQPYEGDVVAQPVHELCEL
jgi:hypothetical protein